MKGTLSIAMDGPSASGKGTIARKMAAHFSFAHLDTGLLYRAIGWQSRQKGILDQPSEIIQLANAFETTWLEEPALRLSGASEAASRVAVIPEVRSALLKFQRDFATTPPQGAVGAVLDGRDIGTVILPHAMVKIFVTADVEIRARRRFDELRARGEMVDYETVLGDLISRDQRDMSRSSAPLLQAPDAVLLDTSHMGAEEAVRRAIDIVREVTADRPSYPKLACV